MLNRREFLQAGSFVAALAVLSQATLAQSETAGASAGKMIDKNLPVYEIYALKYAEPFKSKLAFVYYKNGWDQDYERYYYIWAVKGEKETILVDTGVGPTLAAKKKVKNGSIRFMSFPG